MTRHGILTGGTWCVDRNYLVDRWPEENGRAHVQTVEMSGGGSACNLAVDIKKLAPDLPVATIGVVGDDEDGEYLLHHADANQIERGRMTVIAGLVTDQTWAFATMTSGQRTHISRFGSSHALTPDHFDLTEAIEKIFHLGLPGIHERMDLPWHDDANGWVTTLKKAQAAGLMTNLELASLEPDVLVGLIHPCLPHLDLLVVNDAEIGAIAGIETVVDKRTDPAAVEAAARAVLERSAMDLVAVHFPLGAIIVTHDGTMLKRPSVQLPDKENKGANGAGDAFAAGFLYGVHEEWDLDKTLSLAHATAAVSLRSISTTAAIEPWRTCLELAQSWGWRDDFR